MAIFMYYWIIFELMLLRTILTYGMETSLSIALLVLILATLFIQRARKYGLVISHIYAIIVGLYHMLLLPLICRI